MRERVEILFPKRNLMRIIKYIGQLSYHESSQSLLLYEEVNPDIINFLFVEHGKIRRRIIREISVNQDLLVELWHLDNHSIVLIENCAQQKMCFDNHFAMQQHIEDLFEAAPPASKIILKFDTAEAVSAWRNLISSTAMASSRYLGAQHNTYKLYSNSEDFMSPFSYTSEIYLPDMSDREEMHQ